MVKKLDWFILRTFLGPFVVTFAVVVFILENQFLLRYIEDFMGRDIEWYNFVELLFYFSLNMVPMAMPLGILVSSLITFGNLGEHRELTAIKASGISLTRIIRPVMIMVIGLAIGLFFFNNNVLPWANLQGFSLLYDLRNKKPALDFKEGRFYDGLEGYKIRVGKKDEDGQLLKDLLIYDHSGERGNLKLTTAKEGKMYSIMNERYLVLDLFDGNNYSEQPKRLNPSVSEYTRTAFDRSKVIFSLAGFDLSRTDQDLFKGNKVMKNLLQLKTDMDSMNAEISTIAGRLPDMTNTYYLYLFKEDSNSLSTKQVQHFREKLHTVNSEKKEDVLRFALNQSRNAASLMRSMDDRILGIHKTINNHGVEFWRKFAMPVTCLVFFLIGAPIGAIVKKGGLGVPIIVSILFFVIYYIINMMGERWGKEDVIHPAIGMWLANFSLVWVAGYFTRQAWLDANLFNGFNLLDFFRGIVSKFRNT